MSRAIKLALAALALAGCEPVTQELARLSGEPDGGSGVRALAMLGGDVVVQGPAGYCVDSASSDAAQGFAVMAGCRLLTRDVTSIPVLDGLITVQFGAAQTASVSGNEEAFAAFLQSPAGRALLSARGDMASVAEVTTIPDNSAVLAQFEDTSGPTVAGTGTTVWRGFMDVRGRLVTVSVLSFDRAALSIADGERLLVVAMAQLVEVNASPDAG